MIRDYLQREADQAQRLRALGTKFDLEDLRIANLKRDAHAARLKERARLDSERAAEENQIETERVGRFMREATPLVQAWITEDGSKHIARDFIEICRANEELTVAELGHPLRFGQLTAKAVGDVFLADRPSAVNRLGNFEQCWCGGALGFGLIACAAELEHVARRGDVHGVLANLNALEHAVSRTVALSNANDSTDSEAAAYWAVMGVGATQPFHGAKRSELERNQRDARAAADRARAAAYQRDPSDPPVLSVPEREGAASILSPKAAIASLWNAIPPLLRGGGG